MAIDISQLNIFHKIKFMLHTGEQESRINHIKYWLPEFMKTNIEFCVLTRNEKVFKELSKEYKSVTILFATAPLDVEQVVNKIQTLASVFYTSNTGNNIHLLRFIEYKHIFIGSENSDRDSKITKFMRSYDEIWLSSDAVIDKIKTEIDIRDLKLIKIGKPQLKNILSQKREKVDNGILYIPSDESTKEDNDFSSLKILPSIISKLGENNLKFDFFLNKNIGKRDKRFLTLEKEIVESAYQQNIEAKFHSELSDDLIVKNKYIICDITTFNNKLLASGSIILLYIPDDKIIENYTIDKYMSYDFIYTFSSVEELSIHFFNIKNGNDSMKKEREKGIEYWLGCSETKDSVFKIKLYEINNNILSSSTTLFHFIKSISPKRIG